MTSLSNSPIIDQLIATLYSGVSPYSSADRRYVDGGYPHTNIVVSLLETLFAKLNPTYIVEFGSMLGGSAMMMAKTLKSLEQTAQLVCVDPFTGDVNMWDWESGAVRTGRWRFLHLENGVPTIYKRFLANCKHNGFENQILPINATTTVGVKLLMRLHDQNRINALPNYIYLDSAHEPDETYIELSLCWQLLSKSSDGILFGDDWGWQAVRNDVTKFAASLPEESINYDLLLDVHSKLTGSEVYNKNVLLYQGQWVLFKKRNFETLVPT